VCDGKSTRVALSVGISSGCTRRCGSCRPLGRAASATQAESSGLAFMRIGRPKVNGCARNHDDADRPHETSQFLQPLTSGAGRARDHGTWDDHRRRRDVPPGPMPRRSARGVPLRRFDVIRAARPVCSHPLDRSQDDEALSRGCPHAPNRG
jgi:hypothetical protein